MQRKNLKRKNLKMKNLKRNLVMFEDYPTNLAFSLYNLTDFD
jgi:hypothetical protein